MATSNSILFSKLPSFGKEIIFVYNTINHAVTLILNVISGILTTSTNIMNHAFSSLLIKNETMPTRKLAKCKTIKLENFI